MKVYFYIPKIHWQEPPPPFEDIGTDRWLSWGLYNWTIQTYYRLQHAGIECDLVNELPESGIIIYHRGAELEDTVPTSTQLFVCIQADWGRSNYAHVHISQNPAQEPLESLHPLFRMMSPGPTFFVHYWPQPGIVSRNKSRPNELQVLGFFGLELNLAEELKSDDWKQFIDSLGLEWRIVDDKSQWRDYSDVDAVLFCRDFSGLPHDHKPATKLYNSWIAGCLPICTPESAYKHELVPGLEAQIIVESYEQLKDEVRKIKESPEEYARRLENGAQLAPKYSYSAISEEWRQIIGALEEIFQQNLKSGWLRHQYFVLTRKLLRIIRQVVNK